MIDRLAGGDILKFEQILKMPYRDIMMALWVNKEKDEYRRRLDKTMRDKAKRNSK